MPQMARLPLDLTSSGEVTRHSITVSPVHDDQRVNRFLMPDDTPMSPEAACDLVDITLSNAPRGSPIALRRSFSSPQSTPASSEPQFEEARTDTFSPQRAPIETHHEWLQRSLSIRKTGGPQEHTRNYPFRMRNSRCCEIIHSSLQEPLAPYKTLEPFRPYEQKGRQRFHDTHGFKVFDHDTIVVPARDQMTKTRKGLLRSSSGTVTYSYTHRMKAELDIEELCRIACNEGIPGGGRYWSPKRLERVFKERTGRSGIWQHYEVPFRQFLELFPKTFELINDGQHILLQKQRDKCQDDIEDVIMRLAIARDKGVVEPHLGTPAASHKRPTNSPNVLHPDLMRHRFRAAYAPFD